MRSISDKQGKALKAATRRALDMAGGPESFQHATRVRQGQLSKYAAPSEEHADSFMPLDIALEADLEAGTPIIAEQLARMQGYRLVRIEDEPVGEKLSHRDLSALHLEFSDVVRVAHDALEDGHADEAERRRIGKEIAQLKKALAVIEGKIGGGA